MYNMDPVLALVLLSMVIAGLHGKIPSLDRSALQHQTPVAPTGARSPPGTWEHQTLREHQTFGNTKPSIFRILLWEPIDLSDSTYEANKDIFDWLKEQPHTSGTVTNGAGQHTVRWEPVPRAENEQPGIRAGSRKLLSMAPHDSDEDSVTEVDQLERVDEDSDVEEASDFRIVDEPSEGSDFLNLDSFRVELERGNTLARLDRKLELFASSTEPLAELFPEALNVLPTLQEDADRLAELQSGMEALDREVDEWKETNAFHRSTAASDAFKYLNRATQAMRKLDDLTKSVVDTLWSALDSDLPYNVRERSRWIHNAMPSATGLCPRPKAQEFQQEAARVADIIASHPIEDPCAGGLCDALKELREIDADLSTLAQQMAQVILADDDVQALPQIKGLLHELGARTDSAPRLPVVEWRLEERTDPLAHALKMFNDKLGAEDETTTFECALGARNEGHSILQRLQNIRTHVRTIRQRARREREEQEAEREEKEAMLSQMPTNTVEETINKMQIQFELEGTSVDGMHTKLAVTLTEALAATASNITDLEALAASNITDLDANITDGFQHHDTFAEGRAARHEVHAVAQEPYKIERDIDFLQVHAKAEQLLLQGAKRVAKKIDDVRQKLAELEEAQRKLREEIERARAAGAAEEAAARQEAIDRQNASRQQELNDIDLREQRRIAEQEQRSIAEHEQRRIAEQEQRRIAEQEDERRIAQGGQTTPWIVGGSLFAGVIAFGVGIKCWLQRGASEAVAMVSPGKKAAHDEGEA